MVATGPLSAPCARYSRSHGPTRKKGKKGREGGEWAHLPRRRRREIWIVAGGGTREKSFRVLLPFPTHVVHYAAEGAKRNLKRDMGKVNDLRRRRGGFFFDILVLPSASEFK